MLHLDLTLYATWAFLWVSQRQHYLTDLNSNNKKIIEWLLWSNRFEQSSGSQRLVVFQGERRRGTKVSVQGFVQEKIIWNHLWEQCFSVPDPLPSLPRETTFRHRQQKTEFMTGPHRQPWNGQPTSVTCFATLLQNDLESARFSTLVQAFQKKSGCCTLRRWILASVWMKLCHTRELCHLLQNKIALRVGEMYIMYRFYYKSRPNLYCLQQLFSTCNNLTCYETGWLVGGKMCNIAIQVVSKPCYKTSWTLLLPFLPYLKETTCLIFISVIPRLIFSTERLQ